MGNHVTSWAGIATADEQHRKQMERGSNRLLLAIARELHAMEARHG